MPMSISRAAASGASLACSVRQHEMPGERRLDRDLGRLDIADLADHDHVRVGADHRAQPGGEGEARLRVHLDLLDAVELVLDRILDGHDRPVRAC